MATWETVRATSSRLAKVEAVSQLLSDCGPSEIGHVVLYLSGELPQGKIGLGFATVGAVDAPAAPETSLELDHVDQVLRAIKGTTGPGSKKKKEDLLRDMLSLATDAEQEFLRRLLVGALRQGALEGIMADAVAEAAGIAAPLVRRAAMMSGDLALVAEQAFIGGTDALAAFGLKLGTAVQPMLAQTATDVATGIEKIHGEAAVEWKVDGARVQVHRNGDDIHVFTRNLREITNSAPDVVRAVASLAVESIILDGEAVALRTDNRPVPFQETISRFAADGDGKLNVVFFDCLHLNGVDLIDATGTTRWQAMEASLPETMRIPRIVTDQADVAQTFFDQAIANGYEGVMIKSLDAPYEAGRRGAGWLKVKPVHTLDLVVLAVEWGSGRRKGWLSNIHLGARDPEVADSFIMLGKTFKGMTDDMLRWQTERFLELESDREGHVVYLRPEQVVEVAVDGIQSSSKYPGGVALRFARVKQYRSDKSPAEADTIETVRKLGETVRN